jgi:hypothetical protein
LVRRRQLARQLRLLRERAGLTLEAAAPELDWSPSKLSRIETAQQMVDVHAVRSMLDLYRVGGDAWTEMITLCRESRQRGWWRAYGLGDDSFIGFETAAVRLDEYNPTFVPGLLQVSRYARALFAESGLRRSPRKLRDLVAVRAIRQQRLTSEQDPIEIAAVIDECVLHRPVGGARVLAEQLRYLVEASRLPTVTLQVLPTDVGARHPTASGFVLMGFGDLGEPDIAYVEHSFGSLFVDQESDVAAGRVLFDRLRSAALDPGDSRALIEQLVARDRAGDAHGAAGRQVVHE